MNRITTCFKSTVILLSLLIGMSAQMYGAESVVFSDDFEWATASDRINASGAIGTPKDWTPAGSMSQASGAIKFNASKKNDGEMTLKTPLDLSANGGSFTIKIKAIRWTTDVAQITMSALDGSTSLSTKSVTPTKTGKAPYNDDTMEEFVFEMTGGTASTVIVISGVKRFFITDFTVLQEQSTPTESAIIAPATVDFGTIDVSATADQTITITGANLTEGITAAITDDVEGSFGIKQGETLPAEGGDIIVSAVTAKKGVYTATLTLTSGSVSKVVALTVEVVAPTLAAPVALDADNILENAFTANWEAVTSATSYILSVSKETVSASDGTKESPYSVANSRAGELSGNGWLVGYIVGTANGSVQGNTLEGAVKFTVEGAVESNIVLADSPTEKDGSKLIAVQLTTGNIRTALNLAGNPTNFHKCVAVQGAFENYFGTNPGVKSLTAYTLDATPAIVSNPVDGSPFEVINATSYEVIGLTPLTTYKYDVIAKGLEVKDSEMSNTIYVTTTSTVGLSTAESISTIYTSGGAIHLSAAAGEMIEVYNQMGQRLYAGVAVDGVNQLRLSARGVLVVKAGTKVARVVL